MELKQGVKACVGVGCECIYETDDPSTLIIVGKKIKTLPTEIKLGQDEQAVTVPAKLLSDFRSS